MANKLFLKLFLPLQTKVAPNFRPACAAKEISVARIRWTTRLKPRTRPLNISLGEISF